MMVCRLVANFLATIMAQVIKLSQKLTDDAATMFIKLIGRMFSRLTTGRSSAT